MLADVMLSSDFIAGFCGETEEEHQDTLSLMRAVQYDMAYMFAYSMRKVRSYENSLDKDQSHNVTLLTPCPCSLLSLSC